MLVVTALTAVAQTGTEHLKFMGVPINGTLTQFVTKLKAKGLRSAAIKAGMATLKGEFAGYKGCTIYAFTLKPKNVVSKVSVVFSGYQSWSQYESHYLALKDMLTEKYGEPSACVEEFQSIANIDNDLLKLMGAKSGACKYVTDYISDKGQVELSIESGGEECWIRLLYIDKANANVVREKAINDL